MGVLKYLGQDNKYHALPIGDTQSGVLPKIYTTEEQIIGKWLDGKPLYCKTIPLDELVLPAFAANTVITNLGTFTVSAGSSNAGAPFRALDKVYNNQEGNYWWSNSRTWWKLDLPKKFFITNLTVMNTYSTSSTNLIRNGVFYTDAGKSTMFGVFTATERWQKKVVYQGEGIQTSSIYYEDSATTSGLGEVFLEGYSVPTLPADYEIKRYQLCKEAGVCLCEYTKTTDAPDSFTLDMLENTIGLDTTATDTEVNACLA